MTTKKHTTETLLGYIEIDSVNATNTKLQFSLVHIFQQGHKVTTFFIKISQKSL